MNWWLVGVALILVVLLIVFTSSSQPSKGCGCRSVDTAPSITVQGSNLLIPTNHYYTWMLTDDELRTNPVLDICYPLPSFRTLEGVVQVVDKYSYDLSEPLGSKHQAKNIDQYTVLTPFAVELLIDIVRHNTPSQTEIEFIGMKLEEENIVRLTLTINDELHDFLLAFRQLEDSITSIPRLAVKNVGYFSNQVVYKNRKVDIIQRYTTPLIQWHVTPDIPISWHSPIQQAFGYWNKQLALTSETRLELDLSQWQGSIADPSINLFCTALSSGYIGVGTSAIDHRSGDHAWSRIAIDPASVESQVNLFPGGRSHQDQLIRYAIIHELGHTLGLRHNFVAQIDRNSSYMAYFPSWYPNSQGEVYFLTSDITGIYDELAIEYGYRSIEGETLDVIPSQLQKRIDKAKCLFHTDENVDSDKILAQAHRHAMMDSVLASKQWMRAWQRYRGNLFQRPEEHQVDVRRVFFFLNSISTAVSNSLTFVRGYNTDYRREGLVLDDRTEIVLGDVVECMIGESWRLGEMSNQLTGVVIDGDGSPMTTGRPYNGRYTLDKAPMVELHLRMVLKIARGLLVPERVGEEEAGKLLIGLLTTPIKGSRGKKTILSGSNTGSYDTLQMNALTGILATVEHYKDRYTAVTQLSFERAIQSVMKEVSGQTKEYLARMVTQTSRGMGERGGGERGCGGCGNH